MRLVVNKNSKYEKNYSIFQMQKQFKPPQNKTNKQKTVWEKRFLFPLFSYH